MKRLKNGRDVLEVLRELTVPDFIYYPKLQAIDEEIEDDDSITFGWQ